MITTHILDTALGKPAADVPVLLASRTGGPIADGKTDANGRLTLLAETQNTGDYKLVFDTMVYYYNLEHEQKSFYPKIEIWFRVTDPTAHYHVPLLLSPYGYSTYRGS